MTGMRWRRQLKNPGRPATDCEAERALRHAVITRRISFGARTSEGSRAYAALLSVIETCIDFQKNNDIK